MYKWLIISSLFNHFQDSWAPLCLYENSPTSLVLFGITSSMVTLYHQYHLRCSVRYALLLLLLQIIIIITRHNPRLILNRARTCRGSPNDDRLAILPAPGHPWRRTSRRSTAQGRVVALRHGEIRASISSVNDIGRHCGDKR